MGLRFWSIRVRRPSFIVQTERPLADQAGVQTPGTTHPARPKMSALRSRSHRDVPPAPLRRNGPLIFSRDVRIRPGPAASRRQVLPSGALASIGPEAAAGKATMRRPSLSVSASAPSASIDQEDTSRSGGNAPRHASGALTSQPEGAGAPVRLRVQATLPPTSLRRHGPTVARAPAGAGSAWAGAADTAAARRIADSMPLRSYRPPHSKHRGG